MAFNFIYDHGDSEGMVRTENALNRIANAFPTKDDCWVAESFRRYIDAMGVKAEAESGWLTEHAAALANDFIASQFPKPNESHGDAN